MNSLAPKHKCIKELIFKKKKSELEKQRSMSKQKSVRRKYSRRVGMVKVKREHSLDSPAIKTP